MKRIELTTTRRRVAPVLAAMLCLLVTGCGGGDDSKAIGEPGPPVGQPVLPDLVPAPPSQVQMTRLEGKWYIRFTSILVNVGESDFVLRASRGIRDWQVEQDIPYSTSGAEPVSVDATLVWGGDGHGHWHVSRVASVRLVAVPENGDAVAGEKARVDTKIGFCFFDYSQQLERGPDEAVYSRESCGDKNDTQIGMGLSPGWGDTYHFVLPGQYIDVSGLPDGRYRLWAEVDERGWFREVTRDNNRTWVDIELSTRPDRLRTALIVEVGPEPA